MASSGPFSRTGGAAAPSSQRPAAPPQVWDPLIRITHWAVALAVVANGLINKPGSSIHIWIGWGVIALLALRIGWGFIGPKEARFSSFPPNPVAAMSHLADLLAGKPKTHASHNPAGAMMVYALWGLLAVVSVTGLVMTEGKSPVTIAEEKAAVAAGDWSVLVTEGDDSHEDEDRSLNKAAKEVHEIAANLILILALVHVGGVFVEGRAMRRNLVTPMLFGAAKRKGRNGK